MQRRKLYAVYLQPWRLVLLVARWGVLENTNSNTPAAILQRISV